MEFVVIESSKKACAEHIKQHIRQDILGKTKTDTKCTLQAIKIYNHYYPIISEFLPKVLSCIIIDYANELFEIDVCLRHVQKKYITIYDIYIVVTDTQLNIYHKHRLQYFQSNMKYAYIDINYIDNIEKKHDIETPKEHLNFIDYYMKQYNPKKEQLCGEYNHDIEKNHWNYLPSINAIISHIKDYEQFDNELTVIIALFNSLYNFVV